MAPTFQATSFRVCRLKALPNKTAAFCNGSVEQRTKLCAVQAILVLCGLWSITEILLATTRGQSDTNIKTRSPLLDWSSFNKPVTFWRVWLLWLVESKRNTNSESLHPKFLSHRVFQSHFKPIFYFSLSTEGLDFRPTVNGSTENVGPQLSLIYVKHIEIRFVFPEFHSLAVRYELLANTSVHWC